MHVSFRRRDQLDAEVLLEQVERVVQSNTKFLTAGPLTVIMTYIEVPQGSGKLTASMFSSVEADCRNKKGIVTTKNHDDKLCLARALAVSQANYTADSKVLKDIKIDRLRL
jgi:hypothetical protein